MGGRGEVLGRLNQAWVLQTEGRGSLERSSEDGSDRIVVNWTWSERGTEPATGAEAGMLGGVVIGARSKRRASSTGTSGTA